MRDRIYLWKTISVDFYAFTVNSSEKDQFICKSCSNSKILATLFATVFAKFSETNLSWPSESICINIHRPLISIWSLTWAEISRNRARKGKLQLQYKVRTKKFPTVI